jgi:hypothetical protein
MPLAPWTSLSHDKHREIASGLQYTVDLILRHNSHIVAIFPSKPQISLTVTSKYRRYSETPKGIRWDLNGKSCIPEETSLPTVYTNHVYRAPAENVQIPVKFEPENVDSPTTERATPSPIRQQKWPNLLWNSKHFLDVPLRVRLDRRNDRICYEIRSIFDIWWRNSMKRAWILGDHFFSVIRKSAANRRCCVPCASFYFYFLRVP